MADLATAPFPCRPGRNHDALHRLPTSRSIVLIRLDRIGNENSAPIALPQMPCRGPTVAGRRVRSRSRPGHFSACPPWPATHLLKPWLTCSRNVRTCICRSVVRFRGRSSILGVEPNANRAISDGKAGSKRQDVVARSAFGLSNVVGRTVGPARSRPSTATLAHNRGAGGGKGERPEGRRFGVVRSLPARDECQPDFCCESRKASARAGIDRGARASVGQIGYRVVPAKWTVSFPFTTSGVMAHVPRHVVSATLTAAFSPAKR